MTRSETSKAPDHETAVLERYASAAESPEQALCCPTSYDPSLLRVLPDEIVAKDYGCGDPSRFVREGEVVVDLGSGAGKICYILSQKVGPAGRVIGVDMNDRMLALARKYREEMARRIGHSNVAFVKARIQDMALDLEKLDAWLDAHPVRSVEDLAALDRERDRLRAEEPAVPGGTADVVVSNCVLNLVRPSDKEILFAEMFRVLRNGGRAVISDIVCDEEPTERIRNDPDLWSGCIAGAFREDEFPRAFERAGFHGVEILSRAEVPWRVVDGIEFRSVTIRAFKGKQGPCLERNQAVVYRGPFSAVRDDDGHEFRRGERAAVCDKTFRLLTDEAGPYAGLFLPVPPRVEIPLEDARPFACRKGGVRDPRETKGAGYRESSEFLCGESGCC
ncbi:MAG: methyltransferase domain-containing protein [Planctomycetota bacterium]